MLDVLDRTPPSLTELIHTGRIAFLPLVLTESDASLINGLIRRLAAVDESPGKETDPVSPSPDELAFFRTLWAAARFSEQHHVLILTCPGRADQIVTFEKLGIDSCLFIDVRELLERLNGLALLLEGDRLRRERREAATSGRLSANPSNTPIGDLRLPSGWRLDQAESASHSLEMLPAAVEIDASLRTLIAQVFNKEFHNIELMRDLAEEKARVAHLSAQVAHLDGVLAEVRRSAGWDLLCRAVQMKHRLLPHGTRRNRVFTFGLRFARVCATQGVRSGISRAVAGSRRKVLALTGRAPRGLFDAIPEGSVVEFDSKQRLDARTTTVDVIVCVHNALDDVRLCLESIVAHAMPSDSLILVDDGSRPDTRDYLVEFSRKHRCRLIRNETAKGYTLAANQGLKASSGDFAIMLNSDTVVSSGWIDRMVACAESDPRIGLVGPLSNTASWQSIPEVRSPKGDWAENPLGEGRTPGMMAEWLASHSARLYPRMAFLNGFCLLIRRELMDQIDLFDEAAFGRGYGEENDYCLRAAKAGWQLAVADDVYVYHRQSRSYSHTRRKALGELASVALEAKHGRDLVESGVEICRGNRILQGIRARARWFDYRESLIEEARSRWRGKRMIFILPAFTPCGGANVVVQECDALRKMGIDAQIYNFDDCRAGFQASYPDLEVPVIYRSRGDQFLDLGHEFDALIATIYFSVKLLEPFLKFEQPPALGYYIQDFEPYFAPPGSRQFGEANHSYTRIPEIVRFTKTEWNREEVYRRIGVDCHLIGPSVNLDLFRPRARTLPVKPGVTRIAAMIRPASPYREPGLTMQVLQEVYAKHADSVEFHLFGCESDDPDFLALPRKFAWRNHGVLNRTQLARVLNEVDVFVDFSSHQAMGLTAMEAMACGATAVVPRSGGSDTFVEHMGNGLIVDTQSKSDCVRAIGQLVCDEVLRKRLQLRAMNDICRYFPEQAAFNLLNLFFPSPDAIRAS